MLANGLGAPETCLAGQEGLVLLFAGCILGIRAGYCGTDLLWYIICILESLVPSYALRSEPECYAFNFKLRVTVSMVFMLAGCATNLGVDPGQSVK